MSIINKSDNIKCDSCRFARPHKHASTSKWTAYECGNWESKHYGDLLNIDKNGNMKSKITWLGCSHGVGREIADEC